MNAEQVARIFGCTIEQARAQYFANASQLLVMAARARSTGKKVNGYTVDKLAEAAAKMIAAV